MRRAATLFIVLLAVLLGACGQGGAPPHQLVVSAASATQDSGSAKMQLDISMSGAAQPLSMRGEGAIEFASQRSRMTMNVGALPGAAGEIEMVTDGPDIYMKLPNAQAIGMPTAWVKLRAEDMAGAGANQFSQLSTTDPARGLEMLRGASDDVREVGAEDVRGTPTTHYSATVDLERAIDEAPEKARAALQQQMDMLGTKTIPVDVWIDEQGLVRRQTVTMDLSKMAQQAGAGQTPTEMKMTLELYDFGTDVDTTPPPKSEVTDYKDLQGLGG